MEFDDIKSHLIVSKKIQFLEPVLTVSSIKKLSEYFRQSLILELYWKDTIEYKIVNKNILANNKISRLVLLRKFLSKLLRNLIK